MKIFDIRFISGTTLTGLGTIGTLAGIFSFLPPTSNAVLGILLVIICLSLAVFGYRFARNSLPSPAKTSAETLRKAGLLGKKK